MIVMIALFKSFLVELVCFRFYLKSFFLDGHGTKYKKCMGTQNPRFFPLMGTVPSTKYCWAPGSFDLMGTVPSTINAWAPKTPGFFP